MRICILAALFAGIAFPQNGMLNDSIDRIRYGRSTYGDSIAIAGAAWKLGIAGMNQSPGFPQGFSRLSMTNGVPKYDTRNISPSDSAVPLSHFDIKMTSLATQFDRMGRIGGRIMSLGKFSYVSIRAFPLIDSERYGSKFSVVFSGISIGGTFLWGRGYNSQIFCLTKEWESGILPR